MLGLKNRLTSGEIVNPFKSSSCHVTAARRAKQCDLIIKMLSKTILIGLSILVAVVKVRVRAWKAFLGACFL